MPTDTPTTPTTPILLPDDGPAALQTQMHNRFRGYFPVVIDLETSGFDAQKHCILELAMITLAFTPEGLLAPKTLLHHHIEPFEGAELCPKSLAFTGIDPLNPLRSAISETKALKESVKLIKAEMKEYQCHRAVVVAHNAHFDQGFLKTAMVRSNIKRSPFHPFTAIDTASLASVFYGQTVLAKACKAAHIEFDAKEAHSALYDAHKTAALFCSMVNQYKALFELKTQDGTSMDST